jgi:hypothetical protein
MASGVQRTRGLVALLDKHAIDIAGLQEVQTPQYRTFVRPAGRRYGAYHPPGDTENSVVWRRDRWTLVQAQTLGIPYFNATPRRMPILTQVSPRQRCSVKRASSGALLRDHVRRRCPSPAALGLHSPFGVLAAIPTSPL